MAGSAVEAVVTTSGDSDVTTSGDSDAIMVGESDVIMVAESDTATAEPGVDVAEDQQSEIDRAWVTIVWDDPVNLMNYVTHVFMTVFGYSQEKSTRLMLQVHQLGKAIVSSGPRERMEFDTSRLHGYGLWATVSRDS